MWRLEDVWKTSCLENVLEDALNMSWQDVLKVSGRRLENVFV